jgi:hypothetical protein
MVKAGKEVDLFDPSEPGERKPLRVKGVVRWDAGTVRREREIGVTREDETPLTYRGEIVEEIIQRLKAADIEGKDWGENPPLPLVK